MRQVNGWGFRRVNHGPDRNSYYHECFLRGFPELCRQMRRPSSEELRALKSGPSIAPNFYEISKRYPLPEKQYPEPEGGDELHNPDLRTSMMDLELLKRSSLSPSINPYLLQSEVLLNRIYDARSGPIGSNDILIQRAHPDLLHSHGFNGISQGQHGLTTSSLLQGSLNKYQQFRSNVEVSPATTELEIIQKKMNAIQQRLSLLSHPLSSVLNSSMPSQFMDPAVLDTMNPTLNLMEQGMKPFHPSKF